MIPAYAYTIALVVLLAILALAAYVDRIYSEMGKFLAREYQDNIDSWEEVVEPRLRLGRESIALSASVLRQLSLAALALLSGLRLYTHTTLVPSLVRTPTTLEVVRAACELILLILVFDRLLPQILFTRTRGLWINRIRPILAALFYLILPVTLLLGLLLSIAALAEPEDDTEEDHPSEAMDALLEAGEEEGILEESDRELVRSVVEFGDKIVLEVMTPRPEIFAVPGTLPLQQFTAAINEHAFSRVPVHSGSLDHITGIAFARDLLRIDDTEATALTVANIQRPAAFVPETKKVAELLREMQREKQHMRIVIDEYGSVAGLVTIEDLLEAIVGNIADEHDEPEADDTPIREPDGAYVVTGSFELSRLRDLFADQFESPNRNSRPAEDGEPHDPEDSTPDQPELNLTRTFKEDQESRDSRESRDTRESREPRDTRDDPTALRLPEHYESTTLGGLVSEITGHIPLPGEVVEEDGLRLEVLASTDRRIDRIRVSLMSPPSYEAAK
jgi:putative hemolysin